MAVHIEVPAGVLRRARREWQEAADDLDDGWRRLHRVSSGRLPREVAVALEAFREYWVDQLKAAHARAEAYRDALALAERDLTTADREQAELVRDRLPWVYRTARIEAG